SLQVFSRLLTSFLLLGGDFSFSAKSSLSFFRALALFAVSSAATPCSHSNEIKTSGKKTPKPIQNWCLIRVSLSSFMSSASTTNHQDELCRCCQLSHLACGLPGVTPGFAPFC